MKLFFIGVRWLGPDLSFFAVLRQSQASRDRSCLATWGPDSTRRRFARVVSAFLYRFVRWPGRYFIPDDQFAACMYGPKYNEIDNESYFDLRDVLYDRFGTHLSEDELVRLGECNLGQAVDYIAQRCTET